MVEEAEIQASKHLPHRQLQQVRYMFLVTITYSRACVFEQHSFNYYQALVKKIYSLTATAQCLARSGAGICPAFDDYFAIHYHVVNSDRIVLRIFFSGVGVNRVGVKDHYVCPESIR